MSVKYQNVWRTMNDLETVTSKICSAREILDSAIDAHQEHKHEKVERLLYAVDEFLQYYLAEFDDKFKDAWKATVGDLRDGDVEDDGMRPWGHSDIEYSIANHKKPLTCSKDDPSPECKGAWNDFWEEDGVSIVGNPFAAPESADRIAVSSPKKSWVLPVEEFKDEDTGEDEYCIAFPDDLLEAANLKEGDTVEWIDKGDGCYYLKKVEKKTLSYKEAIEAGWEMTGDGFWLPPKE